MKRIWRIWWISEQAQSTSCLMAICVYLCIMFFFKCINSSLHSQLQLKIMIGSWLLLFLKLWKNKYIHTIGSDPLRIIGPVLNTSNTLDLWNSFDRVLSKNQISLDDFSKMWEIIVEFSRFFRILSLRLKKGKLWKFPPRPFLKKGTFASKGM